MAGVLVKFVNLGKGWRSRLFVLKHGVLRYYRVRALLAGCDDALAVLGFGLNVKAAVCPHQVFGMSKVDVQQLFDALRAEGHLEIIGTEASIIESKWRRCSFQPNALLTPAEPVISHSAFCGTLSSRTCIRPVHNSATCRHPTHGSLHGPASPAGNMSPQQLLSDPTAEVHLQVFHALVAASLSTRTTNLPQ